MVMPHTAKNRPERCSPIGRDLLKESTAGIQLAAGIHRKRELKKRSKKRPRGALLTRLERVDVDDVGRDRVADIT